jgi:hypothetical protein
MCFFILCNFIGDVREAKVTWIVIAYHRVVAFPQRNACSSPENVQFSHFSQSTCPRSRHSLILVHNHPPVGGQPGTNISRHQTQP